MPIIQATTPTNAGWAQSFDTSGVAQIAAQERDRKNKRLQELLTEYDTKGIWDRDTEYIQGKIEAVNDFAMKNSKELANPSKNMKTWQEFQKMQSDVKNSVVYSIGAKEKFDKANQKYNNSKYNMYMTDNNRDMLFAYADKPTAEQYLNKSAFDDPMKGFDANLDIQPQKYVDLAGTFMNEKPPSDTGAVEGGKNVIESKYEMDREGLKEALRPIFSADSWEGTSLQKQYDGDLDAFTTDVAAMTNKPSEYNLVAPRADRVAGKKTQADIEREGAISNVDRSAFDGTETLLTESGVKYQVIGPDGKKASAVMQYGYYTEGKVAQVNQDVPILLPVTVAYSHNQGRMLDVGEGNKYNKQIVREIRDGFVAEKRIELVHTDKNGNKVKTVYEKGEPLPDIKKMYDDKAISKNYYLDLLLPGVSKKQRLATVQASSTPQGYFDKAEGQKFRDTMAETKNEFLTVPYDTIKNSFEGVMKKKYGLDYSVDDYLGDLEEEDWTS